MVKNLYKFIFVLFSCVLFTACQLHKSEQAHTESVCVKTMHICDVESSITRNYVGVVEERSATSLSFGLGGYIKQIKVSEGQFVNKGNLLATLDRTNSQNAYNAAKAALIQAEDAYQRLKKVYEKGGISEIKWVEMQTNLATAKSMEHIAAKNLSDCDLMAPCSGFVGKCHVQAGMNVLPAQPIITLLDIDTVKVKFTVPENEVTNLKVGQSAAITVAALDNKTYEGVLTDRGIVADALSHSYTLKITLPNTKNDLLPGMVCKIQIAIPDSHVGCVVPAHVVQTGIDGHYLWLAKNGKAVRQTVVVGAFTNNGVLITHGLQQGDEVITEGYLKIGEGSELITK